MMSYLILNYKTYNIILFVLLIFLSMISMQDTKNISYLALGDSYTIGECVPIWENFPSLLV